MGNLVRVGSRGSSLALRQTSEAIEQIKALHPDTEFQIVPISTGGDATPQAPLSSLGLSIFVTEIEKDLLACKIDMAVHSLKDMPTAVTDGLAIGAVCCRQDPRDVLVDRWDCPLSQIPYGAKIGTSSPRRAAQLRSVRPDVDAILIRGNVDTRMEKARGTDYDGAILAAAGVVRLGREAEIAEYLSIDEFVPAPGQGALAVQVRQDDQDMLALLSGIDHPATRCAVTAERAFLEALGGGCRVPVGAYAICDNETIALAVFLASEDGSTVFKTQVNGSSRAPHELALDAYQQLIDHGAGPFLEGPRA